jgi:exopolysaccharide biosynthesis polyprenyl glycosylphosphotransferase
MLRRNTNYIIFSFVADLLCIITAVFLAEYFRLSLPFGIPITNEPWLNIVLLEAIILYPFVFLVLSLYDTERTFRAVDEFQIITVGSFVAALAMAGLVYFTARDVSRLLLIYFYIIHFFMLISWRSLVHVIRKGQIEMGRDQRKVLLVGGGDAAQQALQKLKELSWAGIQLRGYLTDGDPLPSKNNGLQLLGSLKDAEHIVQKLDINDVLIALPGESYNKLQELVTCLMDKPCNLWVVQDYFSILIYGSHVENLGGVPMISLKAPALTGHQRLIKRIFDLFFGTILIILFLIPMTIISILIKLDSPGPAIFKQYRVGENGRLFWMYKFRTMFPNAEEIFPQVIRYDKDGKIVHKARNDPRVTRIGAFLRRSSMDELPQFFNVLKGEMSIVGPRPELPVLVEKYESWQRKRFAVPQGITGWWQVNGRSERMMHIHTQDDLYYIQNYSILLDLQILLKTVWVVLKGQGAF